MNLVIDIGNSRTKVAFFTGREMADTFVFDDFSIDRINELVQKFPETDQAILSSVTAVDQTEIDALTAKFPGFIVPVSYTHLTLPTNREV